MVAVRLSGQLHGAPRRCARLQSRSFGWCRARIVGEFEGQSCMAMRVLMHHCLGRARMPRSMAHGHVPKSHEIQVDEYHKFFWAGAPFAQSRVQ